MRRHFSCIDSVTRRELILSEASFNMACSWLETEGFKDFRITKTSINDYQIFCKDILDRRTEFWYDETRGYLLR